MPATPERRPNRARLMPLQPRQPYLHNLHQTYLRLSTSLIKLFQKRLPMQQLFCRLMNLASKPRLPNRTKFQQRQFLPHHELCSASVLILSMKLSSSPYAKMVIGKLSLVLMDIFSYLKNILNLMS